MRFDSLRSGSFLHRFHGSADRGRKIRKGAFLVIPWIALWLAMLQVPAAATDSFEPNDDPNDAHELQNGVQVESWISTPTDEDWYNFEVSQTGTIEVDLVSLPADYDIILGWLNEDDSTIYERDRSENYGTQDEQIVFEASETGLYFLYIYGWDGAHDADDSYLLTASWPGAADQPPAVTVTSPNGGENWLAGTSHAITYTATDPDTPDQDLLINLDYSTNGGGSWTTIASDETNSGTYSWTVPAVPTAQARVRVTASDGTNQSSDTSNADFTISQPPGGENVLTVGTAGGPSGGQATVTLSLDNDNMIKALQADIGFDAAVVGFASGAAAGRATDMEFSYSILGGNAIRIVMYYTSASSLASGDGLIANLTFNLTGSNGSSTDLTPANLVFSDPNAQEVNSDGEPGSISIQGGQNQPPAVTVTSPNGGETWQGGSTQSILYTATDPDTPDQDLTITLEYSTNSGGGWTTIASGQSNTGSHSWTVPFIPTSQARVRVTASDGELQSSDTSNADFTISTEPPSGNQISLGSATGVAGSQVTVAFSLDNEDVVKALEAHIYFDANVASYVSGQATGRGAGMTYSANAAGDTLHLVMYYADAGTLAAGSGTLANLTFQLVGTAGSSTQLVPNDLVLSDPDSQALPVTGQAGSLTVSGTPPGGPVLHIFPMKNPGVPRMLQVFVVSDQNLVAPPTVTADGTNVAMTLLDGANHIWSGVFQVDDQQTSATLNASGSNGTEQGQATRTVTF
ncbi:MAG: hypothetical protein GF355_04640 [Candidatus Eisenbacteria bacterium]|nr:hypothetical protein [Candidatus Eisenbacteria bacterium]